jgi:ferrous iron transport protein A
MVVLTSIRVGEKARVIKIDAGKILLAQLKHMGIGEGDLLKVTQNIRGYLIVAKGNLRLALGRGMGNKITVERVGKE